MIIIYFLFSDDFFTKRFVSVRCETINGLTQNRRPCMALRNKAAQKRGIKMYNALKKRSIQKSLLLTVIFGLAGIALTGIFALGAWYVIAGYASFVDLKPDQISNQWVALNLKDNWGSFAEVVETDSETQESKTVSLYYAILTGNDYSLDFRYMAVCVPVEYRERMDQMMNNGDSIFLSGRILKMDEDTYGYFKDYLLYGGLTEDQLEQSVLPYYIMVFSNEDMVNAFIVTGFLIGIFFILAAAFRLVKALCGGYTLKLKGDIDTIGVRVPVADSDWHSAMEVCKDVKVGRLFTFYMDGCRPRAVPHSKALWVYQNTAAHRRSGTSYSVTAWIDGRNDAAKLRFPNEATAQALLKRYDSQFPWIVVGYSAELRNTFQNDRAKFKQLRYNNANRTYYGNI